jgi:hypothetical protein
MSLDTAQSHPSSAIPGDTPVVPAVCRGLVVNSDLISFGGREESITFLTPDVSLLVEQLVATPAALADLYDLNFDDIVAYLAELGRLLDPERNSHMRWARELTRLTSPQTGPLIDNSFRLLPRLFEPERVRELAERSIGVRYLDGWVTIKESADTTTRVRAYGARTLHIVPGNGIVSAAHTIIKNAITRGDAIIKTPSNNPFCAVAIALTMADLDPDHPLTRHLSVAYWRGGDVAVEERICRPHNIEKIVAWGGFASVKHIVRYVQPGLELIALDPKYSASVIGEAALHDEETMREVAVRLAVDVGAQNQTACSSPRIAYVVVGSDDQAAARLQRFGQLVHEELLALPAKLSTAPKTYDAELRSNVESLRYQEEWYTVIGGEHDEGCVIISHLPDPVEFANLLADRTVNLVPVGSAVDVLEQVDSYTQTLGLYPDGLRAELRDAPLYGVQRLVTLGYSGLFIPGAPHDGLELERRLCKWAVELTAAPIPVGTSLTPARNFVYADDAPVPNTLEALRAQSGTLPGGLLGDGT